MARKFYVHGIEVENFRAFNSLKVDKFRSINMIGGFNGSGKSALLETIFWSMDAMNPLSILNIFGWRQASVRTSQDLEIAFPTRETLGKVTYKTISKRYDISIQKSEIPAQAIASFNASIGNGSPFQGSNTIDQSGLKIILNSADARVISYIMPHADGFAGTIEESRGYNPPRCQILSSLVRPSPAEIAEQVTHAIKLGNIDQVIENMQLLHPDIKELIILQDGRVPTVYAKRGSGGLIPINLLGEGFRSLLTVMLAIYECKGGVVLMDEIDTALHYSISQKIWNIIASVAAEQDCQIFATSHSREAIVNAMRGVVQANRGEDFKYMRLESRDGSHNFIDYSVRDIEVANEYDFEIR